MIKIMGHLEQAEKFHSISRSPERQAMYNRAMLAVHECENDHPESFSFIRQIIQEKPFDDMGLGLTQKQYNVLKEKFEEWEKAQVRGK